jgi:excisionase family DNA binding protein
MKNLTFEGLPQAVGEISARLDSIEKILLADRTPTEKNNGMLTIQEAAEFLHLSVATLYSHVSRSVIPVSKQGKRLYFSRQELTDWIKTGRKHTIAEIKTEVEEALTRKKR